MLKKTGGIALLAASMFFFACGGGDAKTDIPSKGVKDIKEDTASSTVATANKPAVDTKNPNYKKGLSLIANSDCLTCHKVDSKLIGPSYKEIANKYDSTEANIKLLAGKIVKGGSGVWGDVAMTPHEGMSNEDAEVMVKYIFLLKTK